MKLLTCVMFAAATALGAARAAADTIIDGDGVVCIACHRITNPDQSEILGTQYPPYIANDGGNPAKGFVGCGEYVLWNGSELLGPYLDPPAFHSTIQSKLHRQSELCGTCHDISNPVVGDLAPGNGVPSPLPDDAAPAGIALSNAVQGISP